jgi:ABC-type glycerol-3-phosphate transport system substrate-binding protein
MARRIFVTLALSISCALLLAACGGTDNTTNGTTNSGNANRPANTTTTSPTNTGSTTTTTTTTTTSGEKIGVAECDDFIAKYEACVTSKVPAEGRAQWNTALAQWRTSWRQLAENPQTRSTLAQACKMAAEQSRASMKPYGCDF